MSARNVLGKSMFTYLYLELMWNGQPGQPGQPVDLVNFFQLHCIYMYMYM